MAISGSGTSSDPYIVDNWEDFISLAGRSPQKYIKWSDEGTKEIDEVIVNTRMNWNYVVEVDFNGWTIKSFIINISGGGKNDNNIAMIMSINDLTVKNLTVDYCYIKDPRMSFMGLWVNTYWNDIEVDQLGSDYAFWTWDQGRDEYWRLYSPFTYTNMSASVVHMRSQDYSVRFPHVWRASNCEFYIDYKWTKTGASNLWVFGGEEYLGENVYISGKIDASDGAGSLRLFKVTASDKYAAYIQDGVIINIETIVGSNSTLQIGKNVSVVTGAHALIVTDYGNNATANDETTQAALKITKSDLKKASVLSSKSFPFIADDDVRNAQYNSASEDWTYKQSEYVNFGAPFLPFWYYPIYVPPVIYPIERADRISVYDIYEPQNGYDHNGVALLLPSEVESYKEDKGRWDITLKHPLDPYGKWTYIIGQNCIKVNGQIFRIDETEIYTDANQQYITAHANHISYDLKDAFIGDATFEVSTGNAYLAQLIIESQRLIPTQRPTPYAYSFELQSDITGTLQADIHDATVIGAIFGDDNSFANRYGGQLYRDNFHLSVNQTMENIPATPAFKLRYGTDLTKISYKIDFSNWITELLCVDNFGNEWGISYQGSEWIIHHHKTKRLHFSYALDNPDPMACLMADGWNYWLTCNTPKVSIDVAVANLKNDPKYKDFVDLQNLDVGYTGNVYFEQLGINIDLKIVSIRRNELTGDAIQIVLGNAPNSFVRSPVMSQTIVPNGSVEATQSQTIKDMQTEIETVKLRTMRTWAGIKAYKWSDVKSYKWEEIKNGNADN